MYTFVDVYIEEDPAEYVFVISHIRKFGMCLKKKVTTNVISFISEVKNPTGVGYRN